MQRCDHDEANTRSTVHVLNALNKGYNQVSICTADTDVVILMGQFPDLITMHLSASILFGLDWAWGKISRICGSLGPKTSRSLRIFHSFTGCDTNFHFQFSFKIWDIVKMHKNRSFHRSAHFSFGLKCFKSKISQMLPS